MSVGQVRQHHHHGPGEHGHSHGLVDDSIKRSREGVRAVLQSLAVLALAAAGQTVIYVLSGSVALLADLIHNFGDALTAVPLGIAFVLRSPRAERAGTALASIAAATVLVALKLGTGLITGSLGLVSAGIESSGDVVAAVMTYFAIRLGGRPADESHHYGHRRAENLGALGEAAILLVGGGFIVTEAITQLPEGDGGLDARWYLLLIIGIALAA